MSNIQLQIVDVKQERRDQCRVMICQFSSLDFDWHLIDGLSFIVDNQKIESAILESLTIAKKNSVEVLVFPELSIPEIYLSQIQKWSEELSTIVIAGSHYYKKTEGYVSRCPIIVNGTIHFTEKIMPSPIEKSPIKGEGLINGSKICTIINSLYGNLAVLICSDYLSEDVKDHIEMQHIDILCVVAFQRQSDLYYRRFAVDCENSENGIYILYSNFLDKINGDGGSSLFGIMDKAYSEKFASKGFTDLNPQTKLFTFKETDRYTTFDLSLLRKRPYINKNIATEPNVYFVSKNSIGQDSLSKFTQKIAHDDERYIRIDDYYVKPKEYNEIKGILESNNLIFIVGDPGIGKTYTAVKLLKEYYQQGYEPIWFSGLDKEERATQSKTLIDFEPTDKQVIYFEDPFGKIAFEKREALYQVFSPLMSALKQYDTKVIITSRREIFEKFSKESLLPEDVLKLRKELNVRKPSYDNKGLKMIFDKLSARTCLWYPNKEFQSVIHTAIEQGKLTTPLSIRDLVFSIRNLNDVKLIKAAIRNRGNETVKVFALEIVNTSISARLLLYLVFYLGKKGHAQMSKHFDLILPQLRDVLEEGSKPIFNIELRSQIGFRIEQYGSIKTFYKFSHPVYEEALAELAGSDYVCKVIVERLLVNIANEDATEAYRIINSFVMKYPTLAISLFTHLLENRHALTDSALKVLLCQKLISISFASRDTRFFELANRVYPLTSLVAEINEVGKNSSTLADKLNLASRYKNLSPIGYDYTALRGIDWEKLFKGIRAAWFGYRNLNYLLTNCQYIEAKSIGVFLKCFPLATLKRAYLVAGKNERENLKDIFNNTVANKELSNMDRLLTSGSIRNGHSKTLQVKKVLFSDFKYYGEIDIDEGAFKALKKYYNTLLPVGILKIRGKFDAGTIIGIVCKGKLVAVGMAEYSSIDLNKIKGFSSRDFPQLLNTFHTVSAVQSRYMVHLFSPRYQADLSKWENHTF